ncbi:unnamed protein product [Caenorhabditis brenneri]
MESQLQLLDMPEDPMMHILERCDFVSLQCLRKTCHTFRNFIDRTKPKQSMKVLKVGSFSARIHLTTYENEDDELYPVGQKIELVYDRVSSDHTKIFWHRADGGREKTINTGDNFGVFSNDLTTVLDFKQPKWDMIHLKGGEYLLEEVQDVFLSQETLLKVHTLIIESEKCKKPIIEILSSVCPDTLTCLELDSYRRWNMSKIKKLEQWKKVKEFYMNRIAVRPDIDNYSHFELAKVGFTRVKVKDLLKVQEIFLNTPSITKHLEIDANTCPHPDYLERIFGESFLIDDDRDQYKCWFFMREDNRVLQMEFWDYLILFRFKIITMEAVPEDAFISSS